MARQHLGRHRAPDYSPLSEIADIAARSAQPAMKVSAVAVASGGLVATFALPASAAPAHEDAGVTTAAGAPVSTLPQIAGQTVAVAAPAVDNAVAPTFGVVGVHGPARRGRCPADPDHHQGRPARAGPRGRSGRCCHHDPRLADHDPHGGSGPLRRSTRPRFLRRPAASSASRRACPASTTATAARRRPASTARASPATSTALAGKSIPRTAEAQRAASSKVSNPAPGDLIFFGYPAYHVGIYAGGGMMYDSPRTGKTTGLHVIWTQNSVSYGRF